MASSDPTGGVTQILARAGEGDAEAAEALFPLVYDELRRLAGSCLRDERAGHTLQATALVHEAFLKLVGQSGASYTDRRHFFAIASTAMRRILVNHAKAKKAEKRGGGRAPIALDEAQAVFEERAIDLLALDEALDRLAAIDPDQARLVELRFFGGMTMEQVADQLDISPRAAHYEWSAARAWLRGELLADTTGTHKNDGHDA